MTHPRVQAEADAEQVRLVLEALALRRQRPSGEATAEGPVLRFLPGGPRPTSAEARGRPRDSQEAIAAAPQPGPEPARSFPHRTWGTARGRDGGKAPLR